MNNDFETFFYLKTIETDGAFLILDRSSKGIKKISKIFFGHFEGIWMKKCVGGTTENAN